MEPIETEGFTSFPKHDGETHISKHPGQKKNIYL